MYQTANEWRKSSKCDTTCVEVAFNQHVLVRDSKRPNEPHLSFDPQSWDEFLAAVKTGEFDRQ